MDSRQEVDSTLRLLLALGIQGFFVKTEKNSKRRMIMKKQYFHRVSPEQFIREFGCNSYVNFPLKTGKRITRVSILVSVLTEGKDS